MGDKFKLPSQTMLPLVVHLVDGDILVFWSSVNSRHKWASILRSVQVPVYPGRQQIYLKMTMENCFSLAIFESLVPATVVS